MNNEFHPWRTLIFVVAVLVFLGLVCFSGAIIFDVPVSAALGWTTDSAGSYNPRPTSTPTNTPDPLVIALGDLEAQVGELQEKLDQYQTPVPPTSTPVPPQSPTPTAVMPTADATWYLGDPSCILLQDGDNPIGTACFPRDDRVPPYRIPIPEGGWSLAVLGVGSFNGHALSPVAEDVGHVIFFPGSLPDGTTPKDLNQGVTLTEYIAGSAAITHITKLYTYEDALAEAETHATGMLESAPSCGREACNTVYFWEWDFETDSLRLIETFTRPTQ